MRTKVDEVTPKHGSQTSRLEMPKPIGLWSKRNLTILSLATILLVLALFGGASATALVQAVVDGLRYGLVIAMAALGLSLVFGTTGLINFAHGSLVTLGAVVAYWLQARGGPGMSLVGATAIAVVVTAGVATLIEAGIFGPLRRRSLSHLSLMVVSIGLDIAMRNGLLFAFGTESRPYTQYAIQRRLEIWGVHITPLALVLSCLSVIVLLSVGVALKRTRFGQATRAVADNPALAEASGISVRRIVLSVWAAGGALAALGGVSLGLTEQVKWNMGFLLLLLMFAAVILGGIGTTQGVILGGLLVGVATQVGALYLGSQLKVALAMAILVVTLLIRPHGLLGRQERVG